MPQGTTIFVCTTCQRSDVVRGPDEVRSGEALFARSQPLATLIASRA